MQTINIFINGEETSCGASSLLFAVGPTEEQTDRSYFCSAYFFCKPGEPKGLIEMDLNLTTTQQTTARVKAMKDRNGNLTPTPEGAMIRWTTDNDGSVFAIAGQDNGECVIRATGGVGSAVVTANVEWNGGSVSASINVNVGPSAPVVLELDFDPPTEQPQRANAKRPALLTK